MNLMIPTHSGRVEEIIKNDLLDRLDSSSFEKIINDIYTIIAAWNDIDDPVLARQCKNFYSAYSEKEIKLHIKKFIIKKTRTLNGNNKQDELFVEGANPAIVVAIIVGVISVGVALAIAADDEGEFDPEMAPEWTSEWQDFYNQTGETVVSTDVVTGEDGHQYQLITMSDGNTYWHRLDGEGSD